MNHVFSVLISLSFVLYFTGPARADAILDFKSIDVPGSNFTTAFKINDSGQIVGDYQVPPQSDVDHGYLLSGNNYFKLDVDQASGINDSGQIVGQTGNHGFLLSGATYSTFDVPGSTFTQPLGINDGGQIVGGYSSSNETSSNPNHGFLVSGGEYSTIDFPGSTDTQANDISDSGLIVGSYIMSGVSHGFVLNAGSYTTLDFPGSTATRAYGINDAGLIVGDYEDGVIVGDDGECCPRHGFLLSGSNYTKVDFPGSSVTIATGINNAGEIVGSYGGTNAGGATTQGFLAVPQPVPEPPAFTLCMIGSLALLAFTVQREYRDVMNK
jgi:uncharacterized membrane protein